MMKNCSLELRLSPFSQQSHDNRRMSSTQVLEKENYPSAISPQEIMVFYNGRLCVYDMTELQARAIIWMASRKEEGCNSRAFEPKLVAFRSPLGFSVKRSLQRFLQKRKKRSQAIAPSFAQ